LLFIISTERISFIIQNGGGTRIGKAIEKARYEFFNYGRNDVARFMIVLTDGNSDNNEAEESQAARLPLINFSVIHSIVTSF